MLTFFRNSRNKPDDNQFWKHLQYIHGNSTRLPILDLTDENDPVLESDADKATGFNQFFVRQTFLHEDGHPVDVFPHASKASTFWAILVELEDASTSFCGRKSLFGSCLFTHDGGSTSNKDFVTQ